MTDFMIQLKQYNYDTNETENKGEVSIFTLAHCMTPENFANLLSDYANAYKDFKHGKEIGTLLQGKHPTGQASIVRYCLGIIVGLSQQEHMIDDRNRKAIMLGRKLAEMLKDGTLEMGYMI